MRCYLFQIALGDWDDALDYLGHENPFAEKTTGPTPNLVPHPSRGPTDGRIKVNLLLSYSAYSGLKAHASSCSSNPSCATFAAKPI